MTLAVTAALAVALARASAAPEKGEECSSCKFVSGENGPCGCLADPVRCLYYSCTCCVAK